jgi:aspartyl-tRNA(Asn)/glutamyl-tRNA(Gln) amidotransferase subunit A
MRAFHEHHDVLLTPTMPTLPPTVETVYHSPGFDRWEHAVPFTVPFNLTGQPAGSMPCGLSSDGLPIGVQLVASHHREDLVLRAMRAVEAASPVSAVAGAPGWGTASAPAH